jgi:hypothetical protein
VSSTEWTKESFLQIHHAWQQITENNMRRVWKRILPHGANSSDFEEETAIQEITNIGRELGSDQLENDDVRKLLNSQSEELTVDDLLSDQQRAFEEADNDAEERDNVQVKEFSLKEFEDIFRAVEVNLNYKYILFILYCNISLINI